MKSFEFFICHTKALSPCHTEHSEVSCNTKSNLDLPLESLSLQPFLQSLHKEQWQEVRLGDSPIQIIDGDRGKNYPKHNDFLPNGYCLFLNTKNIPDSKFNFTECQFITKDRDDMLRKGKLQLQDIVMTTRGTIGNIALYDNRVPYNHIRINSSMVILRPNIDKVVSQFLLYAILSNKENITNLVSGSAQPQLPIKDLINLTIPLPPLTIQQKIAEILSSFDDKIDLLHRQNNTLESLALTLFRHYSTHKELDSIIGDIIALQSGYAFKSKDFQNFGKDRILKIKNIQNSVIDIINTDFVNENISKILDSKFRIFGGDILFGMTGAEIGKMGIVPKNNETLWLNQRVGVLREKFKGAKYLAYLHLTSAFGFDYIVNAASGSAQPNISAKDIENCPFYYFTESELHNMSLQISPFFEKMIQNSGTILTLQAMRDIMLKAIFE